MLRSTYHLQELYENVSEGMQVGLLNEHSNWFQRPLKEQELHTHTWERVCDHDRQG